MDCTALVGAWTLVSLSGWQATAGGAVTMRFSGTDATVWLPTVTETDGLSVIPTGAAAVDTGSPVWSVANATNTYWQTGDTVTTVLDTIAGTCVVPGTTFYLSGNPSTCTGIINSIEVTR